MIHYIERRQRLPRIFPAEECVDSTSLSVGHRLRLIRLAGPERGRCPPNGRRHRACGGRPRWYRNGTHRRARRRGKERDQQWRRPVAAGIRRRAASGRLARSRGRHGFLADEIGRPWGGVPVPDSSTSPIMTARKDCGRNGLSNATNYVCGRRMSPFTAVARSFERCRAPQ
jgi:hypothetical protein